MSAEFSTLYGIEGHMTSIWVTTLLTATCLAAAPADFAATWKVKYTGPPMTGPKSIGSMILAFTVEGDRVSGIAHIGTWPGVAPITDVKVEGDKISFIAKAISVRLPAFRRADWRGPYRVGNWKSTSAPFIILEDPYRAGFLRIAVESSTTGRPKLPK
jgi:hypothetical protein